MNSLTIRRILVWVVSMILGFAIGHLIIQAVLPALSPDPNAGPISIQTYGIIYFLVTAIPLGLLFMTWFDYFADTRIWPD